MNIVELKNVCKTYPAFRLHNVSFALEDGTIVDYFIVEDDTVLTAVFR